MMCLHPKAHTVNMVLSKLHFLDMLSIMCRITYTVGGRQSPAALVRARGQWNSWLSKGRTKSSQCFTNVWNESNEEYHAFITIFPLIHHRSANQPEKLDASRVPLTLTCIIATSIASTKARELTSKVSSDSAFTSRTSLPSALVRGCGQSVHFECTAAQ